MKKLLVANWKMNPATLREAETLARSLAAAKSSKNADVVICPPFTYLPAVSEILGSKSSIRNSFSLGAQDVFWENKGAYTGEISPGMLKGAGVRYVIVGHSERRVHAGETDEMVCRKTAAAQAKGLSVILCVGEPAEVRRRGIFASKEYVLHQLERDLANGRKKGAKLVIAYEPRWAIGTGNPCSVPDAADMAGFIRRTLRDRFGLEGVPVLYGGSVDAKNAGSYAANPEIDGILVGGASLKAAEFKTIISLSC